MEAEADQRREVDVFAIYETVWQRACDEGTGIRYQGLSPGHPGFFDPQTTASGERNGKPVIKLYRVRYTSPGHMPSRVLNDGSFVTEAQLRSELVTLAHEYGHFRSFLSETEPEAWRRYHLAERRRGDLTTRACSESPPSVDKSAHWRLLRMLMQTELTADERESIIREELLAWRIGQELLTSFAYDDLHTVQSRAQHEVHYHRYRLGIDNLWLCDHQEARCTEIHERQ